MTTPYRPPTKVNTVQVVYQSLVVRADENWQRNKHYEVEYEFDGRVFYADPYRRGAYA